MHKLQEFLGDEFEQFESLGSVEKTSFVLHSELWEDDFSSMLDLLRITYIDDWELRKARKISAFHSPSVRIHLGNWGMLGTVVG